MKKSLLVLLLSSASTLAFAAPFDGFYLGAGFGGSNADFNVDKSVVLTPVDTTTGTPLFSITLPHNADLADGSFAGNIDFGFSHVFEKNFYVGIEAEDTMQNLSATDTVSIGEGNSHLSIYGNTTSSLNNEFALTLNPGIVIHQTTLLYGKIGPAWGDFETKASTQYTQAIFSPVTIGANTHSSDNSDVEVGLRLGVGLEHYLSQHCSLRLEYDHTNYNTIASINDSGTVTASSPSIPAGGTMTNSGTVSAADNSVMLNFNYHFI